MVKVGITGAESPLSGEIIRLLINHPEVELISLYSPNLPGRNITSIHHGFIGESNLNFTDKLNPEDLDLLIITDNSETSRNLIKLLPQFDKLKSILIKKTKEEIEELEAGLSEINRKSLVRGAKNSYVLSPSIVPSLIALGPLAAFLLLNSDIDIEVEIPHDLLKDIDVAEEIKEIKSQLKKRQNSFSGDISLNVKPVNSTNRGQVTLIKFKNSLPLEEIEKIYDQIYDDHNFTFLVKNNVRTEEVEGTQKVVIYIEKPDADTLHIKTVSDARMRGGAGDVVHILNLFFGLHEKTGLQLKASNF